jgi:hypothetical protein
MADLFTDDPATFLADNDLPPLVDGNRYYARYYTRAREHLANLNNRIRGVLPFAVQGALSALDATLRDVVARTVRPTAGTALVAGDFALSGGWGVGASVAVATGSMDQRWRITVTAAGVPGANPTVTLTFRHPPWPTGTRALILRNGGSGSTLNPTWSGAPTTTTLVFTAAGTPVAASTYAYDCIML